MNDTTWRREIYNQYRDAWKIAKLLQNLDETPDPDAIWEKVVKEQNRLADTYGCTPYIVALCNLINAVGKKIEESKHEKC